MNKKGEFGWEQIARIIIVLVVLIILIVIAFLFKDRLYVLADQIKDLVRFGS
ncbi:MAG: hypothetical protein KJ674_03060 [Nanoarchaeota archaeon]|nr:hypothetical protein [Nanoarchaeota archaeon]